jgi:mono/diheme cytochrome c family protein
MTSSCSYNKAELLYPPSTCDTVSVTYSNTVAAILGANCTGCHGGNTPAYGIDLSKYSVVKQNVDNGDLLGTITHSTGYPAMPRNNDKLNDCTINKIKAWILKGAPNN